MFVIDEQLEDDEGSSNYFWEALIETLLVSLAE